MGDSTAKFIELTRYLAIQPNGATKISTKAPRLGPNAISMLLTIRIPEAVFRKPALSARIEIPKEAGAPSTINAKTIADATEAVRQATGLTLSIEVSPETE